MNFANITELMEDATARGRPAVEPLQGALLATFDPKQIMERKTKQKIGRIAKDVMLALGYQHYKYGEPVVGHVFTVASVYCKP